MDGQTAISAAGFYQILRRTCPHRDRAPFAALPWRPHVHLLLFVHRVHGVEPGLYLLVRDAAQLPRLRAALRRDFLWRKPAGGPEDLDLYLLQPGNAQPAAARLCCHQEIAGDGCFSLGMLADFTSLTRYGPWFYPRLFWECGLLGQALYLEAEAAGLRATGIGCFFDDAVHALLGLEQMEFQSLYHFTVGGAVDDPRLTTLPAYPEAAGSAARGG